MTNAKILDSNNKPNLSFFYPVRLITMKNSRILCFYKIVIGIFFQNQMYERKLSLLTNNKVFLIGIFF